MTDTTIGTAEQLRDPNYTPPIAQAIPLGIQHVMAMFASNVTPAIIISGAAGLGFGGIHANPDVVAYMIQMSILFAGIATLIQTIGIGPVGARLPIVQGTSFAFIPVMIPAVMIVTTAGEDPVPGGVDALAGLMTGVMIGGIFHFFLGFFIGKIRFALPPLVTGLIVLMIGLLLIKVGIQYAAGGAGAFHMGKDTWGGGANWIMAFTVIVVTLSVKFFFKGFMSAAAVLIGLVVGYLVAHFVFGAVNFSKAGGADIFGAPMPFKFGFEVNWAIVIGMCLMAFVSAVETVGDVSGITKGGAGREATDKEIAGATFADGLGTAVAGAFGALPNTSFSQNVGLIAMTGIMSRHVVTIGAIFLVICGLSPKLAAYVGTIPYPVLGGGVIVMFGMVAAAGINMLSDVNWNKRNMVIFAVALTLGLGMQQVPDAMKFLPDMARMLVSTGLLPAAIIAIVLNLILPDEAAEG
ncbi:MAG: purine permease [Marinosulfonomonas sp.]|nr:purine permease [Marinosulfonomonas sp.]